VSDYWQARSLILDAISRGDDSELKMLSAQYPVIFANVVRQAKNALSKVKPK